MNRLAVHTAYYVAHTAKSLLWTAGDLVTIYALVSRYRIDPDTAGWLFLTGLAVNALADFAVGVWLDRHPAGTPRLAGAGLTLAAMAFPFTILAAPCGVAALLAATLAFRLGYAAYDVPHNALLSRLGATATAATRLSRGRTIGTGVAAGLVGLGWWRMSEAKNLPWLLAALALAAWLGGMMVIPRLRHAVPPAGTTAPGTGPDLPWTFLLASLLGIVALGAVAKALLHLPATLRHPPAGLLLVLLTGGRTLAALLPLSFGDARRGQRALAACYAGAVPAIPVLLWCGGAAAPLAIGLLLGSTNLIGWAVLPLLARGPRSYGLYTMASKLALGGAGVAMTTALGRLPTFAPGGILWLAGGTTGACLLAALLLAASSVLTPMPATDA